MIVVHPRETMIIAKRIFMSKFSERREVGTSTELHYLGFPKPRTPLETNICWMGSASTFKEISFFWVKSKEFFKELKKIKAF